MKYSSLTKSLKNYSFILQQTLSHLPMYTTMVCSVFQCPRLGSVCSLLLWAFIQPKGLTGRIKDNMLQTQICERQWIVTSGPLRNILQGFLKDLMQWSPSCNKHEPLLRYICKFHFSSILSLCFFLWGSFGINDCSQNLFQGLHFGEIKIKIASPASSHLEQDMAITGKQHSILATEGHYIKKGL